MDDITEIVIPEVLYVIDKPCLYIRHEWISHSHRKRHGLSILYFVALYRASQS